MGNKLTKRQKQQRKKKNTQNKIKKLEKEDALGINRKELKYGMSPKIWVILKIISIVLVPVAYFVYSPALIICMVFTILMFGFAIMAERRINHTYVKSRHMRIMKFDSIFAIIVILITIASTCISANTKKKMPWERQQASIVRTLESFGSCSTGSRTVFPREKMNFKAPSFGGVEPPEGMPPMGMGEHKKFEMKDLPVEMVFSMAVSSVNSVLVFVVPVAGLLTLVLYFIRKRRFNREMDEVVIDSLPELDDEAIEKLFMYGLEEEKTIVVIDTKHEKELENKE